MELRRLAGLAGRTAIVGFVLVLVGMAGGVLFGNPGCGGAAGGVFAAATSSDCSWNTPVWRTVFGVGFLVLGAGGVTTVAASLYERLATPP